MSTSTSVTDTLLLRQIQVIARLQAAQSCLKHGIVPWNVTQNAAYRSIEAPSITVLITLFNYERYILECLESVKYSHRDGLSSAIEILVIDDGSTDGSVDLVQRYLHQTDDALCLVKKAINTGLADARNVGFQLARAPYVFVLDADNKIEPECLVELYDAIVKLGCVSVYGTLNKFDNLTGQSLGQLSCRPWSVESLIEDPYIDAMAMFDRAKILELGGYATELIEYGWFGWEDYELWLKIAQASQSCHYVPKVLSQYRVHTSSMIHSTNHYRLNLSRYLLERFPELAWHPPESARLFGSWRQEVKMEPARSIAQYLHHIQQDVKLQELVAVQNQLHEATQKLEAMKSSKFWKMRRHWIRIRNQLIRSSIPEIEY